MNTHRHIAYMVRALALALACVPILAQQAGAQSRACRSLQAQLASLPTSASAGQAAKYDRAIAQQGVELRRARDHARTARCGGLFASRSQQCAQLNATIARMARNLADLQNKRRTMTAPSGSRRERARLLASLKANGCGNRPAASVPVRKEAPKHQQAARPDSGGAVYRTMCVRLSDGYYFPISFSVPRTMFDRDAEACQARCPGTQVALYAYDVTAQESSAMVSMADGSPYTELDTAYRYRQAPVRTPMYGAAAPAQKKSFTILAGATDKREVASIPAPIQRPDPEAQETGTEAAVDVAPAKREPREGAPAGDRRVRVVGPTFLPDQAEAIDLRAPARTPVRSAQP